SHLPREISVPASPPQQEQRHKMLRPTTSSAADANPDASGTGTVPGTGGAVITGGGHLRPSTRTLSEEEEEEEDAVEDISGAGLTYEDGGDGGGSGSGSGSSKSNSNSNSNSNNNSNSISNSSSSIGNSVNEGAAAGAAAGATSQTSSANKNRAWEEERDPLVKSHKTAATAAT
ncbi:unnamed protein product, partial [Laminaria digitata]